MCGGDADPTSDALIRFAPTDASRAWRARAGADMVGHPPDVGWFCLLHRDQAQALRTSTLADAVAELRRSEPPPAPPMPDESPPAGSTTVVPDPLPSGTNTRLVRAPSPEQRPTPTAPPVGAPARAPRFVRELRSIDIPEIEVGVLFEAFVRVAPDVFADLGVTDVPDLARTQRRTWNPMDGAGPPDCPFTDYVEVAGADDAVKVQIQMVRNQWSEFDVSNASVSIGAWAVGGGHLGSVSTSTRDSTGPRAFARRLHIGEPFTSQRLAALDRCVAAVEAIDRKTRRGG